MSPIMVEIGNVRHFGQKQSSVDYTGVDVPSCQSGTFDSKNRHVSKRGSPRLWKMIFQVMSTLIQYAPADAPACQFLDRKKAGGQALLCIHDHYSKQALANLLRHCHDLLGETVPPVYSHFHFGYAVAKYDGLFYCA